MSSRKVTVTVSSAGVATAAVEDASISDIFTTLLSTDQAVTGAYKYVQMLGLAGAGMMLQEYRRSGSLNPL